MPTLSRSTFTRVRRWTLPTGIAALVSAASCVAPSHLASGDGSVAPRIIPVRSPAVATSASLQDVLRLADGTYISRVLADRDSTLDRWRDRGAKNPIRVYVAPLDGEQTSFAAVVRAAFVQWENIGLPVSFKFLDSPSRAEVTVRWTSQLVNKTGNTVWRVDGRGWMDQGDILLATHLSDGRPLDAASLRAISLHEVGHVIGLGHSDNTHDIMAPLVRVAALSESDRATAKLLYALPAGRVR